MIIGFSGYARAGKSESALALKELGWGVTAFADKLREFLYTLNPMVLPKYERAFEAFFAPASLQKVIDTYGWDGYKDTPYNPEIRRLIQTLGTDCGRGLLGENVWVNATINRIKVDSSRKNWVIQDVRFPNEAKAIQILGGRIIRVNREGVGPVNDHPSETALDDWDFDAIITNTTLDKLWRKAQAFDIWAD